MNAARGFVYGGGYALMAWAVILGFVTAGHNDNAVDVLVAIGAWFVAFVVVGAALLTLAVRAVDAYHHFRYLRRQAARGDYLPPRPRLGIDRNVKGPASRNRPRP